MTLGHQVTLWDIIEMETKCLGNPEKRELEWECGKKKKRLHGSDICTGL